MRFAPLLALLLVSALRADPARWLEHVSRLHSGAKSTHTSLAERKLLADCGDGTFRSYKLDEAALIASGVSDSRRRRDYLATLEKWTASARRVLVEAKGSRERGEALLRFLHEGPLKSYSRYQTSLDRLLDDGSYNCVSSAVLYNILAGRLGLETRGVIVPGHAFSLVMEERGKIDVETTSAEGFDPIRRKVRLVVVRRDGEEQLGLIDPHKLKGYRREVRETGLTALIYANRSAAAARENNHLAGLTLGLRALSLDRESPGARHNVRYHLTKLVTEFLQAEQFRQAQTITQIGVELDPACPRLRALRSKMYESWAASLEKTSPEAAIDLLARSCAECPALARELSACVERSAARLCNRVGPSEAKSFLVRLHKSRPSEAVAVGCANYVSALVKSLIERGEYPRAMSAVEEHASLMGASPREARERSEAMKKSLFRAWGQSLVHTRDWDEAARVYRQALDVFPRDAGFKSSLDRVRSLRRA